MAILVTGGAGYVGSHAVAELIERGFDVVVADSLENGHKEAVWPGARLMAGNLLDEDFTERVFAENDITDVIHFAAYIEAGESMIKPGKYFKNNIGASVAVLNAMARHGVTRFVFSSTAAVYGNQDVMPITEDYTTLPASVYGESKLCVEKLLPWYDSVHGIKSVRLRYFNVCGAHVSGKIGEAHNPETHIIPNVIKAALAGNTFRLMGTDYDTPDGTCVRDYIHVSDLIDAHILALGRLKSEGTGAFYNLGSGAGYSNRQILDAVERVSGKKVTVETVGRRAGDPPTLIASSEKAKRELGWAPKFDSIDGIVETAYRWHADHPNGYGSVTQ